MRDRTWITTLALALALCCGSAAAEKLITVAAQPPGEGAAPSTYTIWLGDGRMREDRDERSIIVDREAGKLYVVKHAERSYHALDLPIDFESLVPESMRDQWRAVLEARKPTVRVAATDETAELSGRRARKYEAELSVTGGATTSLEIWASVEPGFDYAMLNSLMREIHAMQPASAEWIEKLFSTVEGYPLRMVRSAELPGGRQVWIEELAAVEDKPAPEGTWTPPAGYGKVEFNLLSAAPR